MKNICKLEALVLLLAGLAFACSGSGSAPDTSIKGLAGDAEVYGLYQDAEGCDVAAGVRNDHPAPCDFLLYGAADFADRSRHGSIYAYFNAVAPGQEAGDHGDYYISSVSEETNGRREYPSSCDGLTDARLLYVEQNCADHFEVHAGDRAAYDRFLEVAEKDSPEAYPER